MNTNLKINLILSIFFFLVGSLSAFEQWESFYDQSDDPATRQINQLASYPGSVNIISSTGREMDCELLGDSYLFECREFNSAQKFYFNALERTPALFSANLSNPSQPIEILELESVVSLADGQILLVNHQLHVGLNNIQGSRDQRQIEDQDYLEIINILPSLNSISSQTINEHPQIRKIHDYLSERVNYIINSYQTDIVRAETFDGNELECKVISPTKVHANQNNQTIPTHLRGPPERCGIYQCQKGENTDLILVFDSRPGSFAEAQIYGINNQGKLDSAYRVGRVYSEHKTLYESYLLDDYSYKVSNPNNLKPHQQSYFLSRKLERPTFKGIDGDLGGILDPGNRLQLVHLNQLCETPHSQIEKAIETLAQKTAQIELEQVFMILDGSFLSYYTDPQKARNIFCIESGLFYTAESAEHRHRHYTPLPKSSQQFYSPNEVQEMFDYVANMDDIAFGYKQDGCYARAHLMARRLEDRGIHVDKAWINGDLKIESEDESSAPIHWQYHVAPVIYSQDPETGKKTKMILDPSIADRPIELEEWSSIMTQHHEGPIQRTAFPFPQNSMQYQRVSVAISNSDPYYPVSFEDMTEEDKMREARETMREYLNYQ